MSRSVLVEIVPRRNESFEKTVRRFSRKVKKEGIIEKYKEKMYYVKKSDKRRREKYLKKRNAQKANNLRNRQRR